MAENYNEFDVARQRAQQQNSAAVQQQTDAMKRRFAAQGALNSGAAIKQEQLAHEQGAQNLEQANQGINAQEQGVLKQEREAQKQRDFASNEANLGRQFQAGEAEKQRGFVTGERLGSQGFSADQAKLSRDLQNTQFGKQLQLEQDKFGEEKNVNAFNEKLAQQAADQQDIIEKALGNLPGAIGQFSNWLSRGTMGAGGKLTSRFSNGGNDGGQGMVNKASKYLGI
jgi:hypothetical protein